MPLPMTIASYSILFSMVDLFRKRQVARRAADVHGASVARINPGLVALRPVAQAFGRNVQPHPALLARGQRDAVERGERMVVERRARGRWTRGAEIGLD